MSDNVTLEQVEQLAMQLPAMEQLELVARISEQLSRSGVAGEPTRQLKMDFCLIPTTAMADKLLQELDSIADSIGGEFDSGLEIRQIREDRSGQL
jgi:hypothetical protein